MTSVEIISLVVTAMGVCSFSAIFTILYRNYTAASIKEVVNGKSDIDLIDECIYNSQKNTIRRREVLKTIKTALFYVVLIVFVPVLFFSVLSKFNGDVVMIGGKSVMVVASGSMSEKHKDNAYLKALSLNNQFDTYDIIVLNQVNKPSELEVYDVIAFVNDKGVNVIHRIRAKEIINGEIRYVTRGDSNNSDDPYKPKFEDVIGVYENTKIETLGIFIMFFQSYGGMVTIGALVYCLIMIDHLNKKLQAVQDDRLEKLKSAFDFETLTNAKELQTEFTERIYYKGYAYLFNDQGFVEKQEIQQSELTEKTEDTLIRVVETKDGESSEEIIIQSEGTEK